MWIVEFKNKKTGSKGKYYAMSYDDARGHEQRLKSDNNIKAVKVRKVNL